MENKTAISWLVEKFNQCEPMYSGIQSLEHKQYLDSLIEQAKQIEKKQIIIAYQSERYPCSDADAEQYYTDTYES